MESHNVVLCLGVGVEHEFIVLSWNSGYLFYLHQSLLIHFEWKIYQQAIITNVVRVIALLRRKLLFWAVRQAMGYTVETTPWLTPSDFGFELMLQMELGLINGGQNCVPPGFIAAKGIELCGQALQNNVAFSTIGLRNTGQWTVNIYGQDTTLAANYEAKFTQLLIIVTYWNIPYSSLRGNTYMTSALGGGGVSQKKMYKEGLNRFYTIGQCQMRTKEVKKSPKILWMANKYCP